MKLNELKNTPVVRAMPMGKHEVTFDHIQYREDADGEINGVWVHIKEFRPLFIPFFEENNYQLDLLTEQLGIESYDPEEINKATGTVIIAHKYKRDDEKRNQTYTNVSFNPRYNDNPDQMQFA